MNKKKDLGNIEEKIKKFKDICYEHGMRITPQRIAIYRELISSEEHPSATTIYNKVKEYYPNISLGTVNRTLLTFADLGLIKTLEASGDPTRFDTNLKPHHHFRCVKCGKIIDFYNEEYDSIDIPEELEEKFTIFGKIVQIEGICDKCL